jgi:beta-N-acetylhexosaminidase
MIGQMILVGIDNTTIGPTDEFGKHLQKYNVGGVVLYDVDNECFQRVREQGIPAEQARESCPRNLISPEQIRTLTRDLQSLAPTPLFIAVDQEGGRISRLNPLNGFEATPSPRRVGEIDQVQFTRQAARTITTQLQRGGFNMNLAPGVDLAVNEENVVIVGLGRSFGDDPQKVLRHARLYLEEHERRGIAAVVKHFPGHGSSSQDSHAGFVDVTETYEDIEMAPFETLAKAGQAPAIMTAHVYNANLDPLYPATLSKKTVSGLLREEWGFDGVVISDDMQMKAITERFGFEEAIVQAIKAGVDVILVSNNSPDEYDPDLVPRTVGAIQRAIREGKIPSSRIEQSYKRIMQLKKRYGLL